VLRFRLMVKRGPQMRPQASEGEAQHGLFCGTGRLGQGHERLVDETGKIVREVKVASEPAALLAVLTQADYRFKRIGLEAGPLSQWLFSALGEANLPVICVETRHMRAVLQAQINKTDRNDARGIAQMMRVGLLSPGACEDAAQSEAANATDPPQAAAGEGHRC
jgi:Transposase